MKVGGPEFRSQLCPILIHSVIQGSHVLQPLQAAVNEGDNSPNKPFDHDLDSLMRINPLDYKEMFGGKML